MRKSMEIKDLTFLQKTTWADVFEHWKVTEGNNPSWIALAKEKGWPDWQSWRGNGAKIIGAPSREWNIYQINDPNLFIPKMCIGPYQSWQKNFQDSHVFARHTFQDLVDQAFEWCKQNKGVQMLMNNFPLENQFIGIFLAEENRIICFDGTHRSTAITLAQTICAPIVFTRKPTIAIATLSGIESEKLQEMLLKGSQKQ